MIRRAAVLGIALMALALPTLTLAGCASTNTWSCPAPNTF